MSEMVSYGAVRTGALQRSEVQPAGTADGLGAAGVDVGTAELLGGAGVDTAAATVAEADGFGKPMDGVTDGPPHEARRTLNAMTAMRRMLWSPVISW